MGVLTPDIATVFLVVSGCLLPIDFAPPAVRNRKSYKGAYDRTPGRAGADKSGPMSPTNASRASRCGRTSESRPSPRADCKSDPHTSLPACFRLHGHPHDHLPVNGLWTISWVDRQGTVGNVLHFATDGIGLRKRDTDLG